MIGVEGRETDIEGNTGKGGDRQRERERKRDKKGRETVKKRIKEILE
jgi:hypothetical protein